MKTAILLAAFGSRHPKARQSIERITEHVCQQYPEMPVRLAYTSRIIRGHIQKTGESIDSVPEALEKLLNDGVTHVALQSLHLVPGKEFHELLTLANDYMLQEAGFTRIEVGFPLVAGENGLKQVAEAIIAIGQDVKKENDAVLFMGHGTRRRDGSAYYEALHNLFQERDQTIHMGVMEHQKEAGIEVYIDRFKKQNVQKVALIPFLFGAGWHVANDMLGDHEKSWKSLLETEGIHCQPLLKGVGEYDQLVEIWLHHLNNALRRLTRR